jgi:hypothetical protein
MIATQTRPVPDTHDDHLQPDSLARDRDPKGRFAPGNRCGPGNPFYRKQAELRRAVLALFTPEDVASLLRVMLALGRNGDVAAAKVFLEYVVGKPHKAPDPDREELHEWQLLAEARQLTDVTERLENGVPADRANGATRLEGVFDALGAAPAQEPAAEVTEDNGVPAADVAGAAPTPRSQEALRLLTASLRAAVANGVNGATPEEYGQLFARLTGDNGAGRTVPTADNGHGPTVVKADNGNGTGRGTQRGNPAGSNDSPGPRGL